MISASNDSHVDAIAGIVRRAMPADRLGQRGLFADYLICGHGSITGRHMVRVTMDQFDNQRSDAFSCHAIIGRLERMAELFRPGISMEIISPVEMPADHQSYIRISLRRDLRNHRIGCARIALAIIAMAENRLTWVTPVSPMRAFKDKFFKAAVDYVPQSPGYVAEGGS